MKLPRRKFLHQRLLSRSRPYREGASLSDAADPLDHRIPTGQWARLVSVAKGKIVRWNQGF